MRISGYTYILSIALITMLLSVGFLCSDAGTNAVETKPGEKVEVLLKEGKGITLEPDHIVLEFSNVEQDSRCPDDVVCVWQGEAEIALRLLAGQDETHSNIKIPGLVQTPYRGEAVEMALYRFRLLQLDPYPHHESSNEQREYVARLEIERMPGL